MKKYGQPFVILEKRNVTKIVECIKAGTGELCAGKTCPLFNKCFGM